MFTCIIASFKCICIHIVRFCHNTYYIIHNPSFTLFVFSRSKLSSLFSFTALCAQDSEVNDFYHVFHSTSDYLISIINWQIFRITVVKGQTTLSSNELTNYFMWNDKLIIIVDPTKH